MEEWGGEGRKSGVWASGKQPACSKTPPSLRIACDCPNIECPGYTTIFANSGVIMDPTNSHQGRWTAESANRTDFKKRRTFDSMGTGAAWEL